MSRKLISDLAGILRLAIVASSMKDVYRGHCRD
jgi:hypothetical protein